MCIRDSAQAAQGTDATNYPSRGVRVGANAGAAQPFDGHIDELRLALSDWSLWINEKRKIFLDDEILTKNFNEYVYKKMQTAKINDELINQYYAANPPYMSVAGLKRYWEKNDK